MRLSFNYDYASCVKNSERVSWRVDDIIPAGTRLDLTRPLLPRALAARPVACLDEAGHLTLNHLAGNAYLNLFAFVEEFIVVTVVQQAAGELFGNHTNIRALVRFADEEIKHQELFARYRAAFDASFGRPARVLENAAEVAGVVLSKSPMGVMLVILHIELMTQDHYTKSVRDDTSIEPFFTTLLEKHWLEESQHARIDALELAKLVNAATDEQVAQGITDYGDILQAFDGLLAAQASMDVETLGEALGRTFSQPERDAIQASQHAAYRRTFLVAGIRSPKFADTLTRLDAARAQETFQQGDTWAA